VDVLALERLLRRLCETRGGCTGTGAGASQTKLVQNGNSSDVYSVFVGFEPRTGTQIVIKFSGKKVKLSLCLIN
jgi:hypothetical protein